MVKTTLNGPYPRIGSEIGDKLRREINRYERGKADYSSVQALQKALTSEVVEEAIAGGIDVPNYGLIDVHDDMTWPLFDYLPALKLKTNATPSGMKKRFHTNSHYIPFLVDARLEPSHTGILASDLYFETREKFGEVAKLECLGPFSLARKCILGPNAPYGGRVELAKDIARLYNEQIRWAAEKLPGGLPVLQLDEPSLTSKAEGWKDPKRDEEAEGLSEIYKDLLRGIGSKTIVSTFYGETTDRQLEILNELPVDAIGLDFVWGGEDLFHKVRALEPSKGIGFGIVDNGAGEDNRLDYEDPRIIANTICGLHDRVDLGKSYISLNAETEQLPRSSAIRKIGIIKQAADIVRKYTK
jgi:methionine synthase II (cobalamin-independent)